MADRAALPNGTSIGVHVMERERDLLFRVIEGEKEYRIYSNGQIEGFGEGAIVINYFDRLLATAIQKTRASPQPLGYPLWTRHRAD